MITCSTFVRFYFLTSATNLILSVIKGGVIIFFSRLFKGIFPAIDLRNGKCVNLIQGRAEAETVFSEDPISVAESWADQGAGICT